MTTSLSSRHRHHDLTLGATSVVAKAKEISLQAHKALRGGVERDSTQLANDELMHVK
jgi:hypothetical protein